MYRVAKTIYPQYNTYLIYIIMPERFNDTVITDGGVVYYTCNSPDVDTLARHGIKPVGDKFGMNEREVVVIPVSMFDAQGNIGTIEAEKILRDIE